MEGPVKPNSQFRETSKDVASSAMSGNMSMSTGTTGNSLAQWGNAGGEQRLPEDEQRHQQGHQENKVKLKYGTFVYLVNGQEKKRK